MTLEEKFYAMSYAYNHYRNIKLDRERLLEDYLKITQNLLSSHDPIISKEEVDRIGKMITREIVFIYDKKVDEARNKFELAMNGISELPKDPFMD